MLTKFVSTIHTSTKRNYIERVTKVNKAEAAELAIKWGYDYWDGSRDTGYGGYQYDGRWKKVAKKMIDKYSLNENSKILDVGSGKGFILNDFKELLTGIDVYGVDISKYAIENSMNTVKTNCILGNAAKLDFDDNFFDLVISINTLHNLYNFELWDALKEIERVSKKNKFICVESYRNEIEKVNLMYWQLTCRCFYKPNEWEFLFKKVGYTGDYEFIFFE